MTRTAILLCLALGSVACGNHHPATGETSGSTPENRSPENTTTNQPSAVNPKEPTPGPIQSTGATPSSGSEEPKNSEAGSNGGSQPGTQPSGTGPAPGASYPTDSQHLNDTASESASGMAAGTGPIRATAAQGRQYTTNKQDLTDTTQEQILAPPKLQRPSGKMLVKQKKD